LPNEEMETIINGIRNFILHITGKKIIEVNTNAAFYDTWIIYRKDAIKRKEPDNIWS
jgi:hypothetical protein